MDINITAFFNDCNSHDLSGSVATHGQNVGLTTWLACKDSAEKMAPPLLNTQDQYKAFTLHMDSMGFSEAGTMTDWPLVELNALFLQLIAGDINENEHLDSDLLECDFVAYEGDESTSGSIYQGDDGQIYYYIGS